MYEMVRNVVHELYEIVKNGVQHCTKLYEIVHNCSKLYDIVQNFTKFYEILRNDVQNYYTIQ